MSDAARPGEPIGANGDDPLREFRPFVEVHAEFLEAVLRHQEALVRGDVAAARAAIASLRDDLRTHIAREEERILPLLEARGGWGRAGDPRFYRDEHAKILALLDRFAAATADIDAAAAGAHRAIVLLIGAETALRTLLEHHDDRERRCLYPDLVRVTSPEERRALME